MSTSFGRENRTGSGETAGRRGGRGRPARYTKDGLLELVVDVFNERGYEAASMEDLAKASGFTKSTFYHHVSGKEELLRMAVTGRWTRCPQPWTTPWSDSDRPVDQLETAVRRTTQVLLAELPYVTLLLRLRGNTEHRTGCTGPPTRHRCAVGRAGQGCGRCRRDPRLTSIRDWSAGCCSAWSTPSPSGTGRVDAPPRNRQSSTPPSNLAMDGLGAYRAPRP